MGYTGLEGKRVPSIGEKLLLRVDCDELVECKHFCKGFDGLSFDETENAG